jgi:hypothetical protein
LRDGLDCFASLAMTHSKAFSRRGSRPSCAPQRRFAALEKAEGSGAPRGASNQCPRDTNTCCHVPASRARKRAADKCTQSAQLICLRGALAFRRSTCGSRRDLYIPAQLQAMLPGWSRRALPVLSCPSPAKAPRASVVMPKGMMPRASRERFAKPRAGAAPCSAVRIASGTRPSDEQGDLHVT